MEQANPIIKINKCAILNQEEARKWLNSSNWDVSVALEKISDSIRGVVERRKEREAENHRRQEAAKQARLAKRAEEKARLAKRAEEKARLAEEARKENKWTCRGLSCFSDGPKRAGGKHSVLRRKSKNKRKKSSKSRRRKNKRKSKRKSKRRS